MSTPLFQRPKDSTPSQWRSLRVCFCPGLSPSLTLCSKVQTHLSSLSYPKSLHSSLERRRRPSEVIPAVGPEMRRVPPSLFSRGESFSCSRTPLPQPTLPVFISPTSFSCFFPSVVLLIPFFSTKNMSSQLTSKVVVVFLDQFLLSGGSPLVLIIALISFLAPLSFFPSLK